MNGIEWVSGILAAYERGMITESRAIYEIFIAAGSADAREVFSRLPLELQSAVTRDLLEIENPSQQHLVESYCGSLSAAERLKEIHRQEQLMRRGIVALQQVIRRRASKGR